MGLVEMNGQDLYELKLKVALNANNKINLIIHFYTELTDSMCTC